MNDKNHKKQSHKDIAMQFLLAANSESDTPISEDTIKEVYNLFSDEQSESTGYQRKLEHLINS